jgi:DNA-binding GntR family transcriptional regulator
MTRGVPKYHWIAGQLRELMTTYEVSRNTVRLALKRLTDERLLVAEQGRGTFVRESPRPFVQPGQRLIRGRATCQWGRRVVD